MKKPLQNIRSMITGLLLIIVLGSNAQAQFLSDTIDIEHYRLDLKIMDFDEGILYGTAYIQMKTKMDNISAFNLDLLKLQVDSAFTNDEEISVSGNDTVIRLHLPTAVNAGEEFNLRIHYHGEPNVEPYGWGGFHFNNGIAYNLGVAFEDYPHNYGRVWYPCIDDFIDRATYDFYITAAEEHKAICTGHLIDVQDNGDGSKTWHWQTAHSLPTYLTSVAVSDYIEIEQNFEGMNGDIPMYLYVHENDSLQAINSFINLPQIMEGFEAHWGPYPFERVGYVSTPKGAMEHATNIAYPTGCIDGGLTYEYLYAHELSHMWFGDKVTCETAEDMWLNEGWAVFNEYLTQEILYGKNAYQAYYLNKKADVLQYCHANDGGYYALYGIPQTITYGETVYQKGALVVHTLRNYMGDDAFFPAVRHYLEQYAYNDANSWNLRDALSEHSGMDLTAFFDSWVFNPGFPQFSVDSFNVVANGNQFDTEVFMKQKLRGTEQFFTENKVMLRFVDAQWQHQDVVMDLAGQNGNQTFALDIEPSFVLVNATDIMADAVTRVQRTIKTTGTYDFGHSFCGFDVQEIGDSAWVSVEHNWVAPDDFLEEIPGVRLSDARYWTIKGNFDGKMTIKGKFKYSKTGYLDNTLLTNPTDSLMILYRRDASENWHSVPFERFGPFNVGFIYVPNMKAGEYTLAVCDETFVGQNDIPKEEIRVFPNPSNGIVMLENLPKGEYSILNSDGKCVQKGYAKDSRLQIKLDQKGVYVFRIFDGTTRINKKLLITN